MKCDRCGYMNQEENRFCSHCGQHLEVNTMWYYSKDDQSNGPFSEQELQELFLEHAIDENTPVWQEGMEEWVPIKETSMVVSKEEKVWFYVKSNQSLGPFSATEMSELFHNHEIDEQTQVWKEGMSDWCYLPQSSLAQLLQLPKDEEMELIDQFSAQNKKEEVQPKPKGKVVWALAVFIAVCSLVALGVLMFQSMSKQVEYNQQLQAQEQAQQEQKEKTAQAKKEQEEKEKEEQKAKEKEQAEKEKENKEKEEQIKQQKLINESSRQSLSPYYANLGAYQVQAQAIESDFMDNYLKGQVNERVEKYNQAVELYNALNQEVANVSYIGVDERSDYVDDYQALVQCYVDLRDYVGTYVSAWDKSSEYEKPEEHKDDIMDIVKNSYGGGTQNASLVDYYNQYEMINLEE